MGSPELLKHLEEPTCKLSLLLEDRHR